MTCNSPGPQAVRPLGPGHPPSKSLADPNRPERPEQAKDLQEPNHDDDDDDDLEYPADGRVHRDQADSPEQNANDDQGNDDRDERHWRVPPLREAYHARSGLAFTRLELRVFPGRGAVR